MSSAELSTPQRVVGRPFTKGVSGCPGGKRKEVSRAERALAKLLPGAVLKLQALLESEEPALMVEGLKLLFKYTLTTADKRATTAVDMTVKTEELRPALAAKLAALNEAH
jgi:hypothetical protein